MLKGGQLFRPHSGDYEVMGTLLDREPWGFERDETRCFQITQDSVAVIWGRDEKGVVTTGLWLKLEREWDN